MTVDQLFENSGLRKKVWSKRGEEVSKRSVSTVDAIKARSKIETVKGNNQ